MKISEILSKIKSIPGSNAKKAMLEEHRDNDILKKVLRYGSDPFTPFHIVKVPKPKTRLEFPLMGADAWQAYFEILDECSSREVTGNAAIERVYTHFCSVQLEDEVWMRKILKKHLAIGASAKTINKVFPGLVPTFEVSLAQKFDMKRIAGKKLIAVEPKLDGIRCFAIVQDNQAQLFARSGKLISNFDDTIGSDLLKLGDGCYDGELMGDDFISIMRQAYRKESVDSSCVYLALFDYLPIEEWKSGVAKMSCYNRFETLFDKMSEGAGCMRRFVRVDKVRIVERTYLQSHEFDKIAELHDEYVSSGFEGAMIKDCEAPYRFGRGYEVMKLKAFHDTDLEIKSLEEGTGKHLGKLGSVVVEFNGVEVRVGSGFSDEEREEVWKDPDSFVGRIVEVRYQEVTPDGSLRFPTFVCFRNDR